MDSISSFDRNELTGGALRGWAEPDDDLVMLRINGEASWLTKDDARRLAAMLIAASYGENLFTPSSTK